MTGLVMLITSFDGYAWFIYGSSARGFAETLDKAKEEWKAAYTKDARR
jgi:hypothetical protein